MLVLHVGQQVYVGRQTLSSRPFGWGFEGPRQLLYILLWLHATASHTREGAGLFVDANTHSLSAVAVSTPASMRMTQAKQCTRPRCGSRVGSLNQPVYTVCILGPILLTRLLLLLACVVLFTAGRPQAAAGRGPLDATPA